jgi:beta-N-acetylhexosaminidase
MRTGFTSSIGQAACGSTALLLLLSSAPSAAAAPQPGGIIVSALAGRPKPSFLERVRAGEMGGVILVGRWTPGEMAAATRQLHAAGCSTGRPLLLMVDQEGGYARRLTWAPPEHTAGELGRLGPASTRAEAIGAARALRRAGVDIDLAPVTDTLSPGGFLRSRSFGSDAHRVAALASTFVRAVQSQRVAATVKHFPGLGTARRSTDDYKVSLAATELAPFRATIDTHPKLVMVSNASYPALDGTGVAAVFSRPIVTGLLRDSFGFGGVVVSDALDAPVPYAMPHAPARALAAGVDLLLYTGSSSAHAAYEQLAADARGDGTVRASIARASARISALERWLGRTC